MKRSTRIVSITAALVGGLIAIIDWESMEDED